MYYDLESEITDDDAIFLERAINQEKDPEMREALQTVSFMSSTMLADFEHST